MRENNAVHLPRDYHEACRFVAAEFKLPEAFICYLFFEKLYALNAHHGIVFFVESELTGFLFKVKGVFELVPGQGYEKVQFKDGTSLGSAEATMSWQVFFGLVYINCTPESLRRINNIFSLYLEAFYYVAQSERQPATKSYKKKLSI